MPTQTGQTSMSEVEAFYHSRLPRVNCGAVESV